MKVLSFLLASDGVDPVVNFGRSALAELKYKFVSE